MELVTARCQISRSACRAADTEGECPRCWSRFVSAPVHFGIDARQHQLAAGDKTVSKVMRLGANLQARVLWLAAD